MDEPMNGLDKDGIQEVRSMLLELKGQGKVILLASHNREDIEVLCDEVYELNHGQMERCGHERRGADKEDDIGTTGRNGDLETGVCSTE